jgi:hypothetical protein
LAGTSAEQWARTLVEDYLAEIKWQKQRDEEDHLRY